jgi:opacity protein-like surface antigen
MRLNVIWAALLCAVISSAANLPAQVAPSAKLGGFPIGVGVGMSSYNLDYGPGRYMEGPVAWANVGLFHGLGVDGSARSIFMFTPSALTRMQQSTFLGGVFYEGPRYHIVRPWGRAAGGLGLIEFPSNNPAYTRDTYSVFAPSGGLDFQVSDHVAIRTQYEYQFWKDYHGPKDLNPQGWTVGVMYYLRGPRPRSHP